MDFPNSTVHIVHELEVGRLALSIHGKFLVPKNAILNQTQIMQYHAYHTIKNLKLNLCVQTSVS